MQIYLTKDGQQIGPYSVEHLDEMLQSETITGDELYWHEGNDGWLPLSQFPGFVLPPASTPPPVHHAASISESASPEKKDMAPQKKIPAARRNWTAIAKTLGTLIIIVGLIARIFSHGNSKTPAGNGPSIAEKLFDNPEERAKRSAESLVLENIKAPSTATFPEAQILFKQYPWYQVYVLVDAQNSFGAYIRTGFVCTLKLGNGDKFSYVPVAGIQEMDESTIKLGGVLEGIRSASNWPGTKTDDSDKQ